MIGRRDLFSLAGAGAAFLAGGAIAGALPPDPDVVAALDALRAGKSTVGGCIVAARGGRTIATYVWGHASLPFGVPVTDRTLFHVGSNGKLITSIAVVQLAEAASIDLNDPIGQHLPGLPPLMASQPISRLMNHTTGLPDYLDVLEDWDRPQPRDAILTALADRPALFQTGEAYSYSNTNYVVLGWLIEHLSGRSYADYVRDHLFEPAGMPTARADAAEQIVQNRAEPYVMVDGQPRHATRMNDAVSRSADGGVLLSAGDVAPWTTALFGDRLVPASSRARVLAPAPFNSGRLAPYGFGVLVERTRDAPFVRHTGGVPGFRSDWMTWPDADLSVLAMVNSLGPNSAPIDRMILTLAESIRPGLTWIGLDPQTDGSDRRTRTLRALLDRTDDAAPEGVLASELTANPAARLPRLPDVREVVPVESWFIGDQPSQGEMVRYRVTRGSDVNFGVVGWTPDDRIYWV